MTPPELHTLPWHRYRQLRSFDDLLPLPGTASDFKTQANLSLWYCKAYLTFRGLEPNAGLDTISVNELPDVYNYVDKVLMQPSPDGVPRFSLVPQGARLPARLEVVDSDGTTTLWHVDSAAEASVLQVKHLAEFQHHLQNEWDTIEWAAAIVVRPLGQDGEPLPYDPGRLKATRAALQLWPCGIVYNLTAFFLSKKWPCTNTLRPSAI